MVNEFTKLNSVHRNSSRKTYADIDVGIAGDDRENLSRKSMRLNVFYEIKNNRQ